MVPLRSLAMDRGLITLAISMTSSSEMLPECLMFLTFLRSRSGSLRALMTRRTLKSGTLVVEEDEPPVWDLVVRRSVPPIADLDVVQYLSLGIELTRLWKPLGQPSSLLRLVSLAAVSPIFLGERPRGRSSGQRARGPHLTAA
ncbi:uncharacterized protein A4U43_C04F280 [Asparagus officinalis]|uniref:Uncharacterized protein n=1 Tax=Asparagus officinalis TaxID=4686 RepID=A0A5P1F1L0_ASPOF|nr:uncharacterized protein A4U43_C04F280 [Asparagus officinalis]